MKALNYLEDVNRAYSKANKLTRKKKKKERKKQQVCSKDFKMSLNTCLH